MTQIKFKIYWASHIEDIYKTSNINLQKELGMQFRTFYWHKLTFPVPLTQHRLTKSTNIVNSPSYYYYKYLPISIVSSNISGFTYFHPIQLITWSYSMSKYSQPGTSQCVFKSLNVTLIFPSSVFTNFTTLLPMVEWRDLRWYISIMLLFTALKSPVTHWLLQHLVFHVLDNKLLHSMKPETEHTSYCKALYNRYNYTICNRWLNLHNGCWFL